jgi:D-alanyl-D-alanine carboxypeptidase/D-alanyl-D-alanine-endopeptidase (penicillin-binding protein 4)
LSPLAAPSARAQTTATTAFLDSLFDSTPFANAFWGALVVDVQTGDTLYARNAGKSFVPASNTKLYTTAAALDLFPPDHRFATRLYARGPVRDGTLYGDLIVRGGGDPSIGPRFADGDYTATFRAWADSLEQMGIRRVDGRVIGDDDLFDDRALGFGWNWDDETYYYAAQIGALVFNDNTIDASVQGTFEGRPASVTWEPGNTTYVQMINQSRTTPSGSGIDEGYERLRGSNRIVITTEVARGTTETEALTVDNPTLFFAHVFGETLEREGIPVGQPAADVDDLDPADKPVYADLQHVATHLSPRMDELTAIVNKRSQNLYAETLLRHVGTTYQAPDSLDEDDALDSGSARAGAWVARHGTWARAGVDTSAVQIRDGSGLSRRNMVTPGMTTHLLRYAYAHPDSSYRRAFYDSLPIGGVDGTLSGRFRGEPAEGNVRAKTGTLGGASALAGYVTTADGRTLAFSLMCNHYTAPTRLVRDAQDAAVNHLATLR